MTTIVTIRPEPGATSTVAEGRGCGLSIEAFPLFTISPLAWQAPDPDKVDGLLIGSANAIRHGGSQLQHFTAKPVFAVGAATAEAARNAGFTVEQTGEGGLQNLLDALGGRTLRLLRIAGRKHVPLTPPAGITIDKRIAYQSKGQPLPDALTDVLRHGEVLVLLHAAAQARHFAAECDRLGIDRGSVSLAALGPRIADAAGEGWRALRAAPRPEGSALLALAKEMCQ